MIARLVKGTIDILLYSRNEPKYFPSKSHLAFSRLLYHTGFDARNLYHNCTAEVYFRAYYTT
jgi:hypothetical protein